MVLLSLFSYGNRRDQFLCVCEREREGGGGEFRCQSVHYVNIYGIFNYRTSLSRKKSLKYILMASWFCEIRDLSIFGELFQTTVNEFNSAAHILMSMSVG